MRQSKATITHVRMTPIATKRRTGLVCHHIIVEVQCATGQVGWGEISDLSHLGMYMPDIIDLERCVQAYLIGEDALNLNRLVYRLAQVYPEEMYVYSKNAIIRAGIDVALHDLVAKVYDVPLSSYLGGSLRDRMAVCYPIFRQQSIGETAANIETVARRLAEGFSTIRLYVGANLDADESFLRTLRERFGDQVDVKSIDASNLLDEKRAVQLYHRLKGYNFSLFESPCHRYDLEGTAGVRKAVDCPVSEHVLGVRHAALLAKAGAVDVFNVAVCFSGGIAPAIKIAHLAEANGIDILIGTTQELSLGTAAQAHFGTTISHLRFANDPTGPWLYREDVVDRAVVYADGNLMVPAGVGLGVDIDPVKMKHLTAPLRWNSGGPVAAVDRTVSGRSGDEDITA